MMVSVLFLLVFLVYNSHADIQQTEFQMIFRQVKVLKCDSDLHMSRYPGRMEAYQEWNQVYVGESGSEQVISHLHPINALKTIFTVELEKFDNNTDIYTSFIVQNASNAYKQVMSYNMHCSGAQRKLISLVNDGYYQYKIDNTLTYDDTKVVEFSCQEKVRTVGVAWINSAGDRIFPYNQPVITLNATEVHNASMLCCIYYTVTSEQGVKTVQRFVKNKTLLIYRKEMAKNGVQPSGTTNCKTSKDNSNITNGNGKDLSTTINGNGKDLSTTIHETGIDLSTTIHKTGKDVSTTINETGKDLSTTLNETGKDLSTAINGNGKDLSTAINGNGKDLSTTINGNGKDLSTTINGNGKELSTTINGNGKDLSTTINGNGKELSTAINGNGKDLSTTINGNGKDQSTTINETGKELSTAINGNGKDPSTTINETGKDESTTINETGKDLSTAVNGSGKDLSTTINETGQNPNITNALDKNSGSTTKTDSNDHDTQTTNYVIVIISSLSALMLILLVSIIAIKTRCWKKKDRLERPRAPCPLPPNEPASHTPFYVNLLFRRECDQEIRAREEPHYEEIMYQ